MRPNFFCSFLYYIYGKLTKILNTLCLFIFILLFFIKFENSLDGIVNIGVTFVVIGIVNNEYVLVNTHHGFDKKDDTKLVGGLLIMNDENGLNVGWNISKIFIIPNNHTNMTNYIWNKWFKWKTPLNNPLKHSIFQYELSSFIQINYQFHLIFSLNDICQSLEVLYWLQRSYAEVLCGNLLI